MNIVSNTGKSLSEALLFAEHGGEHVVYKNCSECQKKFLYTMEYSCTYWTFNSMNNLSSYCGLVDAKIRTSDKDLPVSWNYPVHFAQKPLLSLAFLIRSACPSDW